MHANLAYLVELQSVDARWAEARARLAAFPKRTAALETRLENARQQVTVAKNALMQSLKDRKTFEMDVESWKERVRKYKDQTAQVKSNEAYRALLHEIETAEREVAQAEDRLLDRMVAGEEYERKLKDADAALKVAEGEAALERSKLHAEKTAVEAEAAALQAEREKVLGAIPAELLGLYEQVARRHHGIAMAGVRGESCGQCGFLVRPHVAQEMRRATDEIYRCEGCGRILYHPEPETAPQANAAQGN
jgi:hypothetical protein